MQARKVFLWLIYPLILLFSNISNAQCPTSGTISSNCTTTGNMTIDANTLTVNSGVVVTVTGTLTVRNGGLLNGTGATFNVGGLAETNGSTNRINGGTYNTGGFSTGNGGDFTITGASIAISPAGAVAISGAAAIINNTNFTGVTNWSTNVTTFSMTNTNITASGSIQFEDANITGGNFIAGTSFSTTNGTNSLSNVTIDAGTTASIRNTTIANGNLDIAGAMSIQSGSVTFDNCTVMTGTGNIGTNDADALTFNGGGVLTLINDTQMNVRGSVINNEWYIDDSDVIVTGNFDNAGAEILEVRNDGTINIQGNMVNTGSGSVSSDSGAVIIVDGNYDNTSGSTDVNGGNLVVGGTFTGNNPTGDTGDCSGGGGGCCGANCSTLPVTLIDFSGIYSESVVKLNWSTATELNNDYFTLERSYDGYVFNKIATITGAGTIEALQTYTYIDQSPTEGFVYYRLTQTDYDGTSERLKIILVQVRKIDNLITIYPNPLNENKELSINGVTPEMNWIIYSINGQILESGTFSEKFKISVGNLERGTYILNIQNADFSKSQLIFVP